MESRWDRGHRPAKMTTADVRAFQGVSVFASLPQLRDKAQAYPIGRLAAELEVPDEVNRDGPGAGGHTRLNGTTPDQLLGFVVAVVPLFSGKPRSVRN
jgi:hypothetical protein